MKTCSCSGNNSLRSEIGAVRCECGGALNYAQFKARVISRLNEIEEDQFRMIGALQTLGAGKCDHCGEWTKDFWQSHDRCWCFRCLEFNHDGPITEDDDEETAREIAKSLVRFLAGRGKPVKFHGLLLEEYLKLT